MSKLSADEFLEGEAGGPHHKAALISDLACAAEAVGDEYEYDDENKDLSGLCRELVQVLELVKFESGGVQ